MACFRRYSSGSEKIGYRMPANIIIHPQLGVSGSSCDHFTKVLTSVEQSDSYRRAETVKYFAVPSLYVACRVSSGGVERPNQRLPIVYAEAFLLHRTSKPISSQSQRASGYKSAKSRYRVRLGIKCHLEASQAAGNQSRLLRLCL